MEASRKLTPLEGEQATGLPTSGPFSQEDMQINHRRGGRGVYFKEPNGHVLELLTRE